MFIQLLMYQHVYYLDRKSIFSENPMWQHLSFEHCIRLVNPASNARKHENSQEQLHFFFKDFFVCLIPLAIPASNELK